MKKHAKSYARLKAVKGLYLKKFNPSSELENINDNLSLEMISKVKENEEVINGYIKKHLKRWSIQELNPVNLAILQLCTYELMEKKTPSNIVISEGITLADEFCETKDRGFIHFVLDKINKEING